MSIKSGSSKLPVDELSVTSSTMTSGVTSGSSIPPAFAVHARAANVTAIANFFIFPSFHTIRVVTQAWPGYSDKFDNTL